MVATALDPVGNSPLACMQYRSSLRWGLVPASETFSFFFCTTVSTGEKRRREERHRFKTKRGRVRNKGNKNLEAAGRGAHKHIHSIEESREEAAKRPVHFNPFHKRGGDKRGGLEGEKASNKL